MGLYLGSVGQLRSGFPLTGVCQQRKQDFVPQGDQGNHASQTLAGGLIAARAVDATDKALSAQLLEVVGGLAGLVIHVRNNLPHFSRDVGCAEASGTDGKRDNCFHHRPHPGLVDVYAADTGGADSRRKMPCLYCPGIDKRPSSRGELHPPATRQFGACLSGRYEAEGQ